MVNTEYVKKYWQRNGKGKWNMIRFLEYLDSPERVEIFVLICIVIVIIILFPWRYNG